MTSISTVSSDDRNPLHLMALIVPLRGSFSRALVRQVRML